MGQNCSQPIRPDIRRIGHNYGVVKMKKQLLYFIVSPLYKNASKNMPINGIIFDFLTGK